MKHARSSYTLQEWEALCEKGKAIEPESVYFPRRIPIECPNVRHFQNSNREPKQCQAKLSDIGMADVVGHTFRHKVVCSVCGWRGSRAIGKEPEND